MFGKVQLSCPIKEINVTGAVKHSDLYISLSKIDNIMDPLRYSALAWLALCIPLFALLSLVIVVFSMFTALALFTGPLEQEKLPILAVVSIVVTGRRSRSHNRCRRQPRRRYHHPIIIVVIIVG